MKKINELEKNKVEQKVFEKEIDELREMINKGGHSSDKNGGNGSLNS